MKIFFSFLFTFYCFLVIAQPANDNCANATNLTIDNALLCNQIAANATDQAGECLTPWAGAGNSTMWYKFTATNDSTVLNCIATAGGGYFLSVFGPAPVCQPSCASQIYSAQQTGDPGEHILITGLIPGQDYFIQIDAANPNGPSTSALVFCINLNNPDDAGLSTGATLLDACGAAFSNSTNGGVWQSGSGASFANFDGDGADEMPFIGNNTSWSTFCSLVAGTWQVTVSGVSGCTLPAPNQGVQASLMTGTTAALTNFANSQNPIPPGGSWTSPTITVNAGQCAFIAVDGFAGDACNYTVTLTNITGGCVVLPVEMMSFIADNNNDNIELSWITASETDNDYFILEKSVDGINYEYLSLIDGAGNSNQISKYIHKDYFPLNGTSFYRLRQVNYDGISSVSGYARVVRQNTEDLIIEIYPNPSSSDNLPTILASGKSDSGYNYSIVDITGKIIQEGNFIIMDEANQELTLRSKLNAGIYFIHITSEYGKSIVRKLIVE